MLLRQRAFEGAARPLKGGLHCHTTRSDGVMPPEDVIRQHAGNGYDFLALTDHRLYNYKNYAPEADILILPGMELDARVTSDAGMCFHVVALGPDERKNGYRQDEAFETASVYDQAEFKPFMDDILARGNMVIYCHPQWSCTPARSFEDIIGAFAMEIWNSGCALECELDTDNGFIWDELLARGRRIYAVATDDGHKAAQNCRGWVRVSAENTRDAILNALKDGAFYSSCGPEIYDFYVQEGMANLRCSPCEYIHFQCGTRPTHILRGEGGLIETACAPLPKDARYLRATVMDARGNKAWTNPIFL